MSLAEMRAELRELRRSHPEHMAVSKMRKADVSSMIQKLKVHREETASAGAKAAPAKVYKSASESVKEAKASEFPLEIHADHATVMKAGAKKEMSVKKAKASKDVMVSERADVAAKKPRAKKE